MTAEEHNRTLATLYFIYGAMHGLTLIGLMLLVFVVETATPGVFSVSPLWISVGIILFVILMFAVGLLPVVLGYGLLKRRVWAKPVGRLLGIISLVNIPVGTALGIYTLKFFSSERGVSLYGGKRAATSDSDLQEALHSAQPLMSWSDRSK